MGLSFGPFPGAGGDAPPASAPAEPQKPKPAGNKHCGLSATAKGLANAGLDLLGLILGEAAAVVVIKLAATSIQGSNAILGQDGLGGALTGSGFATDLTNASLGSPGIKPTLGSFGQAAAKGLPILSVGITAVSVAKDAYDAYNDYQNCLQGRGG